MKKDIIFKLLVFILISVGFVFVVVYYSNALPKTENNKFVDWFSHSFDSKDTSKDIIEKTFPVEPNGILLTQADGSDVEIDSWDKNEVYVYIEKRGDKKRVDNYKVTFSATPRKVEIYGKNEQNFWDWGNFTVFIRIKLPKKFFPDVSTSGGDIRIRNMEGDVVCNTSGGNIKINDVTGKLRAKTSGGDIELQRITGQTEINTSGGNLKLNAIDGEINGETSGGNILFELNGENKGVSLRTSGGNIMAYIPENTKAYLDCSTSGGNVSMNIPGNFSGTTDESKIQGSLNGGSKELRLSTSGGNIQILPKNKD